MLNRGLYADAIDELSQSLRLAPNLAPAQADLALAHFRLGETRALQGRKAEALKDWSEALKLQPEQPQFLYRLAWALATDSQPGLRDGPRAVALAETLVRTQKDGSPEALDTLAVAYAEAGRYAEAEKTARSALELAQARQKAGVAEQIRAHLSAFAARKPWRE